MAQSGYIKLPLREWPLCDITVRIALVGAIRRRVHITSRLQLVLEKVPETAAEVKAGGPWAKEFGLRHGD